MNRINLRDGNGPMRLLAVFYAAMAAIALYGTSDGIMWYLGWPRLPALGVAAVIELVAAVVWTFADWRRTTKAERAIAASVLSVAIAVGVASLNWYGHEGHAGQVGLFVGASLAAFTVLVLHANARRRDALRALGRIGEAAQSYSVWDWARHPMVTALARRIASETPGIGRVGSLAAARQQIRTEARNAAIAEKLRKKLAVGRHPLDAEILLAVLDTEVLVERISKEIDYDGWTRVLSADLAAPVMAIEGKPEPAVEAPELPTELPLTGDIVPAQPLRIVRPTSDQIAAMARGLRAEHPAMSAAEIGAVLNRTAKTVGTYLKAAPTGEHPVVRTTKRVEVRPEDEPGGEPRMGFAAPTA